MSKISDIVDKINFADIKVMANGKNGKVEEKTLSQFFSDLVDEKKVEDKSELKTDEIVPLEFNQQNRKRFVRDILCDMKSRVLDSTEEKFDVSFKEMTHLKTGFGYKFELKCTEINDYDMYLQTVEYISQMFNYLFNDMISVSKLTDCKHDIRFVATTEFEIVSEI